MSIPKELIIIIGAFLVVAAVPSTPGSIVAAAVVALENAPEQPTSDARRRSTVPISSEAPRARQDTLHHSVRRGDILIFDLPEELNGHTIRGYALLRAPALSWLVDYSFMWRTLPQDAGLHDVLIRADTEAETDTLVVSITVE